MTYNYQTTPIFSATEMGLKRVFSSLVTTQGDGLTLSKIADQSSINSSDLPFLQILQNGFTSYDTNQDGVISQEELTKMISKMNQQGLTKEQLYSIAAQNSYSSDSQKELIEKIMSNFGKIDTDGDGKVTEVEVQKYLMNEEIEDKKAEFQKEKLKAFSTFYSDTSTTDSSDS